MIIFFYFLILLLILFFIIYDTTLIENYTNRQKTIILIGDSIFDNELYVDQSIVYYIHKKISREDTILFLAKDNSTIQDSLQQQYPHLNQEENNKNTYLFVSVGGNDILQKIVYKDASQVLPNTLDTIISDYDNFIQKLKTKMNQSHIILLTLYYPHASYYRNFDSYIDKWNKNVKLIAKKYHCRVLDLSTFMKNAEDFSHSIEPSDIGGEKIVDNMMNMC